VSIIAIVFPIESPDIHARRRFETDPRGRSFETWLGVARHHAEQEKDEHFIYGFDEIIYKNPQLSI
jgi:hypothetical protein